MPLFLVSFDLGKQYTQAQQMVIAEKIKTSGGVNGIAFSPTDASIDPYASRIGQSLNSASPLLKRGLCSRGTHEQEKDFLLRIRAVLNTSLQTMASDSRRSIVYVSHDVALALVCCILGVTMLQVEKQYQLKGQIRLLSVTHSTVYALI